MTDRLTPAEWLRDLARLIDLDKYPDGIGSTSLGDMLREEAARRAERTAEMTHDPAYVATTLADWSEVIQAILDAVANGEGELYEGYLRAAFAKHGLAVIEVPPCS